ncbi:MAG: molybdate ABC transporter substrate-binding protein [Rhodobacteraceae bacterium]|nr:molybdate ABC transporter substrate-binding protein [Paracoccaceae bacterium]
MTVFAAASLKNALDQVAAGFERTHSTSLNISYAGSSALARQIQYGAPAQIFISANSLWMDILENQAVLAPATRVNLTGNQLVLVAGPGNDVRLEVRPGMDLIAALQGKRLAMALVKAVPAGIYGRQALISLGVWGTVQSHIAQTDNVRAALRLVALSEAPLGIVYATDAVAEPRVRVLGVFPAGSHPRIVYPAALLKDGDTSSSRAFLRFLTGPEAQAIFRQHGFTLTGAPPHE